MCFGQATLERSVKVLEHAEDAQLGILESETVTMAMGLLTAVLTGVAEVGINALFHQTTCQ